MHLYPLRLAPILKERIWGGRRLKEVFGKDLPERARIGESWELADLPGDQSRVAEGALAGLTLAEVIRQDPADLTGRADFALPFPLLVKFLDVQDILSVQVHPDAEACKRMGQGRPKTECWVILRAGPGAFIYKGLKPGVTREVVRRALAEGTIERCLNRVAVQQGECHFLPAGTIHAIGPGLLIAEIQQPSDTTYRVHDFDRVDATGKPRPLHIDQALECIHFDATGNTPSVTTQDRLVRCPFFTVDKACLAKDGRISLASGIMQILVILTGHGTIADERDQSGAAFRAGDCLVKPAVYEGVILAQGSMEYLAVTVG